MNNKKTLKNHGKIGRKAIFFTLSSIMIVTLFMLYFSSKDSLSVKEKSEISESRVTTINNFVNNFEQIYFPRALYATTHRSLYSITDYLAAKASDNQPRYVNLSIDFPQVILNGTIYNTDNGVDWYNKTLDNMNKKTLIFWLAQLTNISREEMNIYSDFNITRIVINQTKQWYINVTAYIEYNISSPGVVEIIRKEVALSTELSIEGLIDPLIAVETAGEFKRPINRSAINVFVEGGVDAVPMVSNGVYIFQNRTAPSFLMRFEKNLNASGCCGIESLISEDIYNANQRPQKSFVDYQYFTETGVTPIGLCLDQNMNPEITLYNITGITSDTFPFKIDKFHAYLIYTKGSIKEANEDCT